jgi:acetyl esterase/lipase
MMFDVETEDLVYLSHDGAYPASVADANHAIRWLKANAARFGARPEMVGVTGTSAGGHLAVLAGMKPFDPRYAALPLEGGETFDAIPARIVTMWPVICPARRYRENLDRQKRGDTSLAHREGAGFGQMRYWGNVETMEDGSPVMALERGDAVETPDLLYVQAYCDTLHARPNMDLFCKLYAEAGGRVETEMLDGEPYDSLRSDPGSEAATKAVKHIVNFAYGR